MTTQEKNGEIASLKTSRPEKDDSTGIISDTNVEEHYDLTMPGLTTKQIKEEWKTLMNPNAEAIRQALEMQPQPGDLSCD